MILTIKALKGIWQKKLVFILCMLLIVTGISGFMALMTTYNSLRQTVDGYYEDSRLADISAIVLRINQDQVDRLANIEGVDQVDVTNVLDLQVVNTGKDYRVSARVMEYRDDGGNHLSQPVGISYDSKRESPQLNEGEIIVSESYLKAAGLKVGDQISLKQGDEEKAFTVKYSCVSPEYLYALRDVREYVPDEKTLATVYMSPLDLKEWTGNSNSWNKVLIKVKEGYDPTDLKARLETELKEYGLGDIWSKTESSSYRMMENELNKLQTYAMIASLVTMAIAAFLLYLIMMRVVEQERSQIGVLKAYGYTNGAIYYHYMVYGVVIAILGSILGLIAGLGLANLYIIPIYLYRVSLPEFLLVIPWVKFLVISLVVTIGAMGGIYFGVKKSVKLSPVEAMRSRGGYRQKAVKRTVSQWEDKVYSLLGSRKAMACSNIVRNKGRALIFIVAVSLCFGLVACLISIFSSLDIMMFNQFRESKNYQVKLVLNEGEPLEKALGEKIDGAQSWGYMYESVAVIKKGDKEKKTLVIGLDPDEKLYQIHDDITSEKYSTDGGMVLSSNLAEILGAKEGDLVTFYNYRMKEPVELTVTKVVNQYYGIYAYTNRQVISENVMGEDGYNSVVLCGDKGKIKDSGDKVRGIVACQDKDEDLKNHVKFISTFRSMLFVFVSLGVALTLVVIVCITALFTEDRKEEYAIMLSMGMKIKEVMEIIRFETVIESFVGMAIGTFVAVGLKKLMMNFFVIAEELKVPDNVTWDAYLKGLLVVVVSLLISELFIRRLIRGFSIPNILKERD